MIGHNIELPIYNSDGTIFNGLSLKKFSVDSVVMSLGDKITGDVLYPDNKLAVTMSEYIEYNGVKYVLVSPPTIVREGLAKDSGSQGGMTKYSFVFYHPMYMLSSIPFGDVAVSPDQKQYLSESKTFSWIGTGLDFIDKLNKNLEGTEWVVMTSDNEDSLSKLSVIPEDVLSFDNNFIADALKTAYDTWKVPFVVDNVYDSDNLGQDKKFKVVIGVPSNEILDSDGNTYTFRFGQGVGLKNNSRTPKNNKIVTRIFGYGSERNIPYGYPQIPWYGDNRWEFTKYEGEVQYDSDGKVINQPKAGAYPIYKGIVGGAYISLIKHPFTRKHLMPTVYVESVFNKISPYVQGGGVNQDYDPDLTLVDYYDADGGEYPNPIVPAAPSCESHQFEDIYPRLGEKKIVAAIPWNDKENIDYKTYSEWYTFINRWIYALTSEGKSGYEVSVLQDLADMTATYTPSDAIQDDTAAIQSGELDIDTGSCTCHISVKADENWANISIVSPWYNSTYKVLQPHGEIVPEWNDEMDEDGNYLQSYFKITLPVLDFDMYACASITEEMNIVMRSGACIGCTFPIEVDWDDYKKNFYDSDGNFAPNGNQRDLTTYPKSNQGQITVIVKKDIDTFGTLMPNEYQQPKAEDTFVITGISLPASYVDNAQEELDDAAKQYMLENNVHYFDYPVKFDECFLAKNTGILEQLRGNTIVRFIFGNEPEKVLYIKQMTVKYGDRPLPQYDITLTDDIEVVLNQIGKVTDDVSRLRVQLSELAKYYGIEGGVGGSVLEQLLSSKLSKIENDIAQGRITFMQGLIAVDKIITQSSIQSLNFESGLSNGKGWRIDQLGNAELESLRVRSFIEVIDVLVNRMQAMEGDTYFSDNDQIEKVTQNYDGNTIVSYTLSLKEKWEGYITAQMYGNILCGTINTLAAKDADISEYDDSDAEEADDGGNTYYTSWMRVIATHATDNTLGNNEITVVLYGDNDTPASKNFVPCELMTITRRGCIDYSDPTSQDYEQVKASIKRRQSVFYLSASEGRIVKLTGVAKPILEEGNYGMVFGTVPDFIKNWDCWDMLLEEHPHLNDRDYLFAQGLIYEDLVHVDIKGAPVPTVVDCLVDWIDGNTDSGDTYTDEYGDTVTVPAIKYGVYFNCGWNNKSKQFERHLVRHGNAKWMCLQNQPVMVGNTPTYYEPKFGSPYWKMMDGDTAYKIDIVSSAGDVFYSNNVSGQLLPKLYYGTVDISTDITNATWWWTRRTQTTIDEQWSYSGRNLTLSNSILPADTSERNKAIFICHVSFTADNTTKEVTGNFIVNTTASAPTIQPNILRRTAFEDISRVADAWEISNSNWIFTDVAADTMISGRKSIRLSARLAGEDLSITQNVYGYVKSSTWYTLSFNSFSTNQFKTLLTDGSGSTGWIDATEGVYVDGSINPIPISAVTGEVTWPRAWDGERHSITFKTNSQFSTNTLLVRFFCPDGVELSICMPKLEEGKYATAYMANDEDFSGADGKMGRSFYYAGDFDELVATGQSFTVGDYETPYVSYEETIGNVTTTHYKVYVGENIDTPRSYSYYSRSGSHPINSNLNDWKEMEGNFKYLITQAIFSGFAKLGSAVFNGDFMLSQYGYKYDPTTQTYVQSNDYSSMTISNGKPATFYPNIWFDWGNGKVGITEGSLQICRKDGVRIADFGVNSESGLGELKFYDTDGVTELLDYGVDGIGYILTNSVSAGFTTYNWLYVSSGMSVNDRLGGYGGTAVASRYDDTYYYYKSARLTLKNGTVKVFNVSYDNKFYDSTATNSSGLPTGNQVLVPSALSETLHFIDSNPYYNDGYERKYLCYTVYNGQITRIDTITIEVQEIYDAYSSEVQRTYRQIYTVGGVQQTSTTFVFYWEQ